MEGTIKLTGAIDAMPSIGKEDNADSLSQKEQQELLRYKQDTEQRSSLAKWVAAVISIWLTLVIALMYIALFDKNTYLSDTVLVALLGTTTVNVLGLAKIILSNLFPASKE